MPVQLPEISGRESFDTLISRLAQYLNRVIDAPASFEVLRTTKYISTIRPLVQHLADNDQHRYTVAALLALKSHYSTAEATDDRDIHATRARACELVAWRFVVRLSDRDVVEHLCFELPGSGSNRSSFSNAEEPLLLDGIAEYNYTDSPAEERLEDSFIFEADRQSHAEHGNYFSTTYQGLSALEIAAVTQSKKFLAQKAIQRIIDGIWKGDIVFWDSLHADSKKEAKLYQAKKTDPFCRLRVPLYLKAFEVLFFAGFLAFYYIVLVTKPVFEVSVAEIALYVWLAAFAYNEFGEFWDAGLTFYAVDFWALWDLLIIADGLAFFITRMIGLAHADRAVIDTAFDILSVEALFLVPRICSVLSLLPFFGTLLPCLKEMTKDFFKFLGLIAILYLGFNTCFAFLARGTYSFSKMSYILVKVFFGSSYLGFDVADQISPVLGPPLMIVFVCLTNILLITSLISLLSNTLSRVIQHSREEYLSVYAVFVLECTTSNRLLLYLPPLNLVPLLLRPLRLFVSADRLRRVRIFIFKALHWPFVACIICYEYVRQITRDRQDSYSSFASAEAIDSRPPAILGQPLLVKPAGGRATSQHTPLADHARRAAHLPSVDAQRPETIEALESLASSLQSQLETVHFLLEQERAKRANSTSA